MVLVLIALGGGLFFLAALFVSMKRVLDRPLADLDAYLRQIALGNFAAIVPEMPGEGRFDGLQKSLEALGAFLAMNGKALHEASQKVRRHAMNLSTAAEEMNAASQEITSTVQQISRGMETQASRTSETSEVMVSMSSNVKQMADKSAAVAEASAQAWETALKGGESVKDAVRKISEIAANSGESARAVEGLGRTSKKIGQVVQIITGIADQTNLLALNAAIEAARAGEAGRGFAVVAEEVRKLAEGSAKAAGEINKLVREIQTETDRAVARMAEAAAEAEGGPRSGAQRRRLPGRDLESGAPRGRAGQGDLPADAETGPEHRPGGEGRGRDRQRGRGDRRRHRAGLGFHPGADRQHGRDGGGFARAGRHRRAAEPAGAPLPVGGPKVADVQMVVFKLAGEQFAAPITRVREILRPVRFTRMPRAADFVRGLFNLRGQVLPLLDLRARLGLKLASPDLKENRSRVVVVEAAGEAMGIQVDEVLEVLRCSEEDLQSPRSVLDLPSSRALSSVLDMAGRLVLVLDVDRLGRGGSGDLPEGAAA